MNQRKLNALQFSCFALSGLVVISCQKKELGGEVQQSSAQQQQQMGAFNCDGDYLAVPPAYGYTAIDYRINNSRDYDIYVEPVSLPGVYRKDQLNPDAPLGKAVTSCNVILVRKDGKTMGRNPHQPDGHSDCTASPRVNILVGQSRMVSEVMPYGKWPCSQDSNGVIHLRANNQDIGTAVAPANYNPVDQPITLSGSCTANPARFAKLTPMGICGGEEFARYPKDAAEYPFPPADPSKWAQVWGVGTQKSVSLDGKTFKGADTNYAIVLKFSAPPAPTAPCTTADQSGSCIPSTTVPQTPSSCPGGTTPDQGTGTCVPVQAPCTPDQNNTCGSTMPPTGGVPQVPQVPTTPDSGLPPSCIGKTAQQMAQDKNCAGHKPPPVSPPVPDSGKLCLDTAYAYGHKTECCALPMSAVTATVQQFCVSGKK